MWFAPTEEQLLPIPGLGSTEDLKTGDIPVFMRFTLGPFQWYVTEYSPERRVMYNYLKFGDVSEDDHWGLTHYDHLKTFRIKEFEVECDQDWQVRIVRDIPEIVESYRAMGIEHLLEHTRACR